MPACLVKHISIKEIEVFPARRNLNVTIAGYGSAPNLVYICHMDTVTLGEGWSTDTPTLGATVRENRLYGRGACDMKGGLACALSALFSLMDAMEHTGTQPERGFSLICTVDEEANMRGVEAAIDAGWVGTDEWVLDTEPTDNQIQVAHKGRTWFELDIKGVTAHASQPWEGADAVAATAEAISHIRRSIEALPHHADWAPRPLPLAWFKADTNPTLSRMHAPRGSICDWYLRQPRRRRK